MKKGFDRKLSFFNEGPKKMKEEEEEYEITSSQTLAKILKFQVFDELLFEKF